ncbi:SLC35B4 isoform 2 [Pan troglodytes]|uniref:Solute carrier family 35 member B4 n=2 Tax=Homininae TaxID=207598 RepID=F8WAW0_HUMAN|nr:solute carrier family 35 member B4 [Homo sapiens]KAI4015890.1 solute carrier family 35 member B4 [Homo sapiens]PNI99566.1 SLC35B4 isoform 2 [Pan troglodytes]
MRPALAVGLVFAGCCSNVIFLELLARKHPGCGNIVTFAQFLFIAVEGFLFEADLGRKPPAIPIRYYAIMVTMFFTVSVVNNYALNLNIAMPLHMIFRSIQYIQIYLHCPGVCGDIYLHFYVSKAGDFPVQLE